GPLVEVVAVLGRDVAPATSRCLRGGRKLHAPVEDVLDLLALVRGQVGQRRGQKGHAEPVAVDVPPTFTWTLWIANYPARLAALNHECDGPADRLGILALGRRAALRQ